MTFKYNQLKVSEIDGLQVYIKNININHKALVKNLMKNRFWSFKSRCNYMTVNLGLKIIYLKIQVNTNYQL